MSVEYYIGGVNFKDNNVFVSKSAGLLDRPKLKPPQTFNWETEHGAQVYSDKLYFDKRDIVLDCFIRADSKLDFIQKVNAFSALFSGLEMLVVSAVENKPLAYMVLLQENVEITKTWSDNEMAGTFQLKLTEFEPVKRVLSYTYQEGGSNEATIGFTSDSRFNVFWGDGSSTYDATGTASLSHEYASEGQYTIVITGDIDSLDSFTTNAVTVWNKL